MLKSIEEHKTDTDTEPNPTATQSNGGAVLALRSGAQLVLMLAILVGAYVGMERMIASKPERGQRPSFDRAVPVDSVVAQPGPERPTLRLFGEVVAGRTIDIRPPAAGEVISVNPNVAVGNQLNAGDVLFSIDPFDLEVALAEAKANLAQTVAAVAQSRARLASEQSQLEIAQEQLEFAKADLERANTLRANGTLTAKQVDDRQLLVSQREQAVSQRQNNILIEEAGLQQQLANERRLQLSVDRAERNLADATATAPFSGVVRSADIQVGRLVSANDVTVSLYDDAALDVRFTLTDAQYGRVATDGDPLIGRSVDVTWRVGGQDYAYVAEVTRLGADVASDRGGIDVFARIADPAANAVQIRPGAFVALEVSDRLYNDALRVSEQIVFDGPSVFVIEDGALRQQPVTLHAYDGEEAVIGGIDAGTVLLATRLSNPENGLRVRTGDEPPQRARPNGPRSGEGRPGTGRPTAQRGG